MNMKILEILKEIVIGQPVSEIPPCPPFLKGSCEKIGGAYKNILT